MKIRSDLRISIIYFIIGFAWITGSDRILEFFVRDVHQQSIIQSFKGVFYVIATSILLYDLIRRSLKKLELEKRRNDELIASSPIGLFRLKNDGTILSINSTGLSILGYSPLENLTGRKFHEFHEGNENAALVWEGILDEGTLNNLEIQITRKDGAKIWAEIQAKVSQDSGETIIECGILDISKRKETEQKYHQEQDLTTKLIDTSPIYLVVIDRQGKTRKMNRTMLNAIGYTWEDLDDQEYIPFMVPESEQQPLQETFQKIFISQDIIQHTNHILTIDGRALLVEWHARAIQNNSGQMEYLFGYGIDITERKERDRQLRLSSFSVENAANPVLWILEDGSIEYANKMASYAYGYGADEMVNLQIQAVDQQIDNERFQDIWQHVKEVGNLQLESIGVSSTGKTFPVEFFLSMIDFEGERFLYCFLQDLTLKKLTEEGLKISEARYRAIVEDQVELIDRILPDGTITFVNQSYCDFYGMEERELIGTNITSFFHEQDIESTFARWHALSPGNPITSIQVRGINAQGDLRWIEWSDRAIFSEKGKLLEIQGVGRDITDQKTAEEKLQQAYDDTLVGWAKTLELRDRETEGHSKRVVELTERIARKLGLSDEEVLNIRWGALLHDIGKLGIPDKILEKPGPLNDEEWFIMRLHPVFAFESLSEIHFLRGALHIPYSHHEKWDGSGYPQGLKGKEIPIGARIFAIVDVWDALNSDRPYRKAWSDEKVLGYIKDESGKHFDPDLVPIFLQILKELD